ncbi:hypothetical protein PCC7424_0217 [Gloeothece citriformis PCC 7424]|uniref:Glycine zipper domain-containing protein n=1 Tax=Gloeothece citriformis (strain PCC 7424) TaxID=65393 RepID=B7KAL3_GLOC7|nr:glycine zipper domain-containing protein [Gloeothece citriformis]ACK68685.1 hypothetical protein PCC7424_0217 [Gloeothece citriformis PCC 7424]
MTNSQDNPSLTQSIETLLWEIVHHTPGRIRIRIAWLQEYPLLHEPLKVGITDLDSVTEVRVSSINNSVTVHYTPNAVDCEQIPGQLWEIIYPLTPLNWLSEQLKTLGNSEPVSNPSIKESDPFSVFYLETETLETLTLKMQTIGGRMIGSSVGRFMGIGIGAVTGGIFLGPLGLIPGGGVGSALGKMVGSQVGEQAVRYLSDPSLILEALETEQDIDLPQMVQSSLERGATELIGETLGSVVGITVGGATLGPVGSLMGSIVGGVIGGQISEQLWDEQQAEKNSQE